MTVKVDSCERTPAAPVRDAADAALVRRYLGGERGAFAELLLIHEKRIARLVWRLLGWRGDVADVVQEVFIRCLENLARFRFESSFATWLTSIAVNECRRRNRRRWRWRAFWRRARREPISPHPAADASPLAAERSQRVRDAVRALAVKYREVIVLRYLEGLEVEEIGRALGLSRSAVDVNLHRARQQLRESLSGLIEEKS